MTYIKRFCCLAVFMVLLTNCNTGPETPYVPPVMTNQGYELIDFYADWCGPCKMMTPIIAEYNAGAEVKIQKLDVDHDPLSAQANDIRSIPTIVLFEDGEEVARLTGYQNLEDLTTWVTEHTN